jgi:hypothetical protein
MATRGRDGRQKVLRMHIAIVPRWRREVERHLDALCDAVLDKS